MAQDILTPKESRVVLVCLLISFVVSGLIWLETLRLEKALLVEQESKEALHWATVLGLHLTERENFLSYGKVLPEDQDLFDFAAAAGRISHYMVYNQNGQIVVSTRAGDLGQASTNPYFEEVVRAGRTYSVVRDETDGDGVRSFESLAVVPVMEDGDFRGAIEVRADVTARANVIVANLRRARYGLLGIVALLGLASAALIRRYLQDGKKDSGMIGGSLRAP